MCRAVLPSPRRAPQVRPRVQQQGHGVQVAADRRPRQGGVPALRLVVDLQAVARVQQLLQKRQVPEGAGEHQRGPARVRLDVQPVLLLLPLRAAQNQLRRPHELLARQGRHVVFGLVRAGQQFVDARWSARRSPAASRRARALRSMVPSSRSRSCRATCLRRCFSISAAMASSSVTAHSRWRPSRAQSRAVRPRWSFSKRFRLSSCSISSSSASNSPIAAAFINGVYTGAWLGLLRTALLPKDASVTVAESSVVVTVVADDDDDARAAAPAAPPPPPPHPTNACEFSDPPPGGVGRTDAPPASGRRRRQVVVRRARRRSRLRPLVVMVAVDERVRILHGGIVAEQLLSRSPPAAAGGGPPPTGLRVDGRLHVVSYLLALFT